MAPYRLARNLSFVPLRFCARVKGDCVCTCIKCGERCLPVGDVAFVPAGTYFYGNSGFSVRRLYYGANDFSKPAPGWSVLSVR